MRASVDASDRTLVIVSGILLVLISLGGLLLAPRPETASPGFPSSYSTSSAGAKAAYLLLEELGYSVERWSSPPSALPKEAEDTVLVLADPFLPASSEEKAELQAFVRRGGRILATGGTAAALLHLVGVAGTPVASVDWKNFPARVPGPISRLAPVISMKGDARWKAKPPQGLAYYGDKQGGTVVSFRLGGGSVIWWADSSPLTNYGLSQASNLDLFLNSVGEARGRRILWDEYYHGQRAGLWTYLARTPLPWAMLQAGLLALAVVLTYSRRSGPLTALVRESRLSPIEFVETVGDLYARKRAATGALEIAYHRFWSLLSKRLGFPAEAGLEKVRGTVRERFAWTEPGLVPVLSQCEGVLRSGINDEAQILKLVQELHNYTRRLRLAGKGD
jgi:hypothetical protein